MIEVENRLRNWGRWLSDRQARHRGRTGSLEGNWRSPQHWNELTRPAFVPADPIDAWAVECACRRLPVEHHLVLKLEYVLLAPRVEIVIELRRSVGWRVASRDVPAIRDAAIASIEAALNHRAIPHPGMTPGGAVFPWRRPTGTPLAALAWAKRQRS